MATQHPDLAPGQEWVGDYPRPPGVAPSKQHIQVYFARELVADTRRALRVLQTGVAPVYYIPRSDVRMSALQPVAHTTTCEFKGKASYYTVGVGDQRAENAAWSYLEPALGYEAIAGHIAFYPSQMEACLVDGERAQPHPGGFFGGWITAAIVGPFAARR